MVALRSYGGQIRYCEVEYMDATDGKVEHEGSAGSRQYRSKSEQADVFAIGSSDVKWSFSQAGRAKRQT